MHNVASDTVHPPLPSLCPSPPSYVSSHQPFGRICLAFPRAVAQMAAKDTGAAKGILAVTPEQAANGIWHGDAGLMCRYCNKGPWTVPGHADGHIGGKGHAKKRLDHLRIFGPRLHEVEDAPSHEVDDAPSPSLRDAHLRRSTRAGAAQLSGEPEPTHAAVLPEVEHAPSPCLREPRLPRPTRAVAAHRSGEPDSMHAAVQALKQAWLAQERAKAGGGHPAAGPPARQQEGDGFWVGDFAVALQDVRGPSGYATVARAQAVEVLYIGVEADEEGWLYVQAPTGAGWVRAGSVEKIPPPPTRPCPRG